jgi:hypothetical protein
MALKATVEDIIAVFTTDLLVTGKWVPRRFGCCIVFRQSSTAGIAEKLVKSSNGRQHGLFLQYYFTRRNILFSKDPKLLNVF